MLFPTNNTNTNFYTFKYPIQNKKPKKTNKKISINYKNLSNKFYIIKSKSITTSLTLKSKLSKNSKTISTPPIINNSFTHYTNLIPKYYNKYYQLLNNYKIHKIKITLSIFNILNLNFSKPIYFKQKTNYYLINKINFKNNKLNILKTIKINI